MKRVLLLGDSVRQNYQDYVKTGLLKIAEVYYPADNGRFCQYTLRYLHEWIGSLSMHGKIEFDIVHFNCGLWDILRLSNEDKPFTDSGQYAALIRRIIERIRYLCPRAQIIFALTTSVIEPGFEPGITIGERRNSDIERYNEVAVNVCRDMMVEVNDLWSVSAYLPEKAHSDMVHFETDIGIKALGDQVIRCIKDCKL